MASRFAAPFLRSGGHRPQLRECSGRAAVQLLFRVRRISRILLSLLCKDSDRPIDDVVDISDIHAIASITTELALSETHRP
jgi:hypothetical protein